MIYFFKLLAIQEFRRLPRRLLLPAFFITTFCFWKFGISLASGILSVKYLMILFLFNAVVRVGATILLIKLMAKDNKVRVEDLAYAIYIKGIRIDQLQMVKDLQEFLKKIRE